MVETDWFEIWTDGACYPNPGLGGWAYLIKDSKGGERSRSGSEPDTTNNRMEYRAAIEALKELPKYSQSKLYSDSRLLVNTMTWWLARWMEENTIALKKNQDLLEELFDETQFRFVEWIWVRGHSGNLNNERVDRLACNARMSLEAR